MREVVAVTQITLDGVMQAPGGARGGPERRLRVRGWSFPHLDEVLQALEAAFAKPMDLLLGRRTYEIFAAYWPYEEGPIADRLNSARKYVALRTLKSLDWDNSTLLEGDVATAVGALKQRTVRSSGVREPSSPSRLSCCTANTVLDPDRSGRARAGQAAVRRRHRHRLELVGSNVSTSGVIMATYSARGRS